MAHIDDRKAALIAQLAAHRAEFSENARSVRESLDVRRRIKSGFAANPIAWIAGAGIAGLALTRFRSRKKAPRRASEPLKRTVAAGLALPVLKILFNLARPTLVSLLTARVAGFAAGRAASRSRGAKMGARQT